MFHNSTPLLGFHFQRNFFIVLPVYPTHFLIFLIPFQIFFQLLYIILPLLDPSSIYSNSSVIFSNILCQISCHPMLRTLMRDFNFYFSFYFIYLSFSFLVYFLFLELGLGYSDKDHAVTWHGHKSHAEQKDVEGFGRMTSYNMLNTCWPYGIHMAV